MLLEPRGWRPPLPTASAADDACAVERDAFLSRCGEQGEELCPAAATDLDLLKCLSTVASRTRGEVGENCEVAMSRFSDCLYGPRLLLPMELASVLLLAAASGVLFCSVLRCCLRHLWLRPVSGLHSARAAEAMLDQGDSEAEEEEEPHATEVGLEPLRIANATASGKAAPAGAAAPAAEDELLPAYTDVVAGAALALQPRAS